MVKKISLGAMSLLYLLAGINHFINSIFYIDIIPHWLPYPSFIVSISGIIEMLLGIGLIIQPIRKISAWLIISMLMLFFILIHIPMAVDYYQTNHPYLTIALVRLPIQFILIYWAWQCSMLRL